MLTGDSFFHLAAFGEALPGLNLCGAGRVVCLIDPVGDVYACPFAIHDNFLAGNLLDRRRLRARSGRTPSCSHELRSPQTGGACTKCEFFDSCRGGCMAAKFFTGLPLDGPDPECVQGYGEPALRRRPHRPGRQPGPLQDDPTRNQPVMLNARPVRRRSAAGLGAAPRARSPGSTAADRQPSRSR